VREQKILLDQVTRVAKEILESKYPDASAMFLAGSIVRGESTSYSDLDLVVIFDKLPTAHRESFYSQGFPIEAFIHDPGDT
jgi:predicted nucleotidyltransferase